MSIRTIDRSHSSLRHETAMSASTHEVLCDEHSRTTILVAVDAVFLAIAISSVFVRLFARVESQNKLSYDDYALFFTLIGHVPRCEPCCTCNLGNSSQRNRKHVVHVLRDHTNEPAGRAPIHRPAYKGLTAHTHRIHEPILSQSQSRCRSINTVSVTRKLVLHNPPILHQPSLQRSHHTDSKSCRSCGTSC